jgi:hypothetical protein
MRLSGVGKHDSTSREGFIRLYILKWKTIMDLEYFGDNPHKFPASRFKAQRPGSISQGCTDCIPASRSHSSRMI